MIAVEERRPRVLLWYWGRRGGGPRYTLELARVLAMREDVEVVLSLSRQSEMYANFEDVPAVGRFDVDTYESLPQFALRSLAVPLLRYRFAAFLRSAAIDVVLCTMDHLWNPFVSTVIARSGALYMLVVHDATRHPGEDQGIRQWLLKRDVASSDGAVVLTESVRNSLVANYAYPRERTYLAPHGMLDYGRRTTPRDFPAGRPIRLLFFGRIVAYKGLDLLLSALPIVEKEFPGVTLEVWGSGNMAPYRRLLDAMTNVRVENRWIGEDEIGGILERTDLAVLPYREASQSGVVAAALAAGMPCVATPMPGLCEQVTDRVNGIIATDVSPAALAGAIAVVLRDRDLYRRLSAGCLHAADTALNWDSIGASVADAIWELRRQGRRKTSENLGG